MALAEHVRRVDAWWVGALVAADQATKYLVAAWIPLHEPMTIIPGLLNLTHVRNTGAAFGMLNGSDFEFKTLFVTALAVAALAGIAAYALRFGADTRLGQVGLLAVVGGAMGNLIDRVTRGYVVDFVDFYWGSFHFWAFNLADTAITLGAIALVLDMLTSGRHVSETA
jgi:signal peptidase II